MGKKTGYYICCENCGKEVYQTKTQYNKAVHHFCSNHCQKEFQHRQTFEDRVCEICGDTFSVSKKSSQRFCSTLCQNKWQTTLTGENSNRFNSERTLCECCEKPIWVKRSKFKKDQHTFCSIICRQKWYAEVWSQSDEWKESSRKRAVDLLRNKKHTTNTKPQIILNQLLDSMQIKYINEYSCIYYSIDNYLPDHNLMIEVMGDFWHAHPNKYNEANYRDMQIQRIIKDKSKHAFIKKHYGIEILYIWEDDLYHNLDLCRSLIELYIQAPELKTYHSYNYHLSGTSLIVNENMI